MSPLWWALAALAQSPEELEQAKQLFRNGATLYGEGQYEEAIRAFQLAWELSGNPKLLFNIAGAQERLGDLRASRDTLLQYRIFASEDEQVVLDRRLRSLEQRLAAQPVPAPVPAPVPMPVPAREPVPEPVPEPVSAPVPELVPVPRRPDTPRWVTVGLGAGLAAAAGTATAVTYGLGRDFRREGDQRAYESVLVLNHVSLGLTGAGGAAVVVGLALPLTGRF
jgi:tetratricopeptide (TPR) repeat protein